MAETTETKQETPAEESGPDPVSIKPEDLVHYFAKQAFDNIAGANSIRTGVSQIPGAAAVPDILRKQQC